MKFKSIIGTLDVEVISIDRIEQLYGHSRPRSIYVNRKFGFVIGWNTEGWFLWELPRNGEEVFENASEGEKEPLKKPENMWIPISITSRYQWDSVAPSVNLFIHEPQKDMSLEDYIRENLRVLVGQKNIKFVEKGTGMSPDENIGFSTIYAELEGRKIYQFQKFIKKGKRIFTLSASNILEGLPPSAKSDMAEIFNSFAFIGKAPSAVKSTTGRIKGFLDYFRKRS